MMSDLAHYLQTFFEGVTKKDVAEISAFFKYSEIKKGEYLFALDRHCDKLSFVKSGLLRIYALHEGKEVTQWISSAGYFATDLASFIFNSPPRWII